ncbi:MAG: hypothetical protein R6V06_02650 [Kiritimatiellia bacterium]
MGIHDPLNSLQGVYRWELIRFPTLKKSIVFIDDQLGHWVFWGGFVLGSWCVGIQQMCCPLDEKMNFRWMAGFTIVAVLLLWVMLTNLWDEYPKTTEDLSVIALALAVLFAAHRFLAKDVSLMRMPVLFVMYIAYTGSISGTLICWQLRYGILF